MAEELAINSSSSKEEKYLQLLPQIEALVADEENEISNMANISAALKQTFKFFWIGFYRVSGEELILGPFQGPIACTRIKFGSGVCGTAWEQKETVIVPDVDKFPGHIACSSDSKSEIVVPGINNNGDVTFVLDIDSHKLNDFDEVDKKYLNEIVKILF
ncbi:MAG: GAF domain-containing protein [Bacteroidota bacterium]